MEEMKLISAMFVIYYSGYYCRAIWRLHRRGLTGFSGSTLGDTWKKYWHSPRVLTSAFRCASRSMGVFLGVEIAED